MMGAAMTGRFGGAPLDTVEALDGGGGDEGMPGRRDANAMPADGSSPASKTIRGAGPTSGWAASSQCVKTPA